MSKFKPKQSGLEQALTMRAMRERLREATEVPKIPKKQMSLRMPSKPRMK